LPELFFITWWNNLLSLRSSNKWAIYSLVFLWLAMMLFLAFKWANLSVAVKRVGYLSVVMAVLMLILSWTKYRQEYRTDHAIIITASAKVMSAPDKKSTRQFVIHEGLKVKVEDQIKDWVLIKLEDGKEGWIESQALQLI